MRSIARVLSLGFLLGTAAALAVPAHAATLQTLHSFCTDASCADGYGPEGRLQIDPQGNLFGLTLWGGSAPGQNGRGTIFELARAHGGWNFKGLHIFCQSEDCADGDMPIGELVRDTAGNLYGVTAYGGQQSVSGGIIFKLSQSGHHWTLNPLHIFAGTDGAQPNGGLAYPGNSLGAVYDGVSPLYGVTENGGADPNAGTVFQLVPSGDNWSLTTLHNFSTHDTEGSNPSSRLTLDASGTHIYGTLLHDQGKVFDLSDAGGGSWDMDTLLDEHISLPDKTYDPWGALLLDDTGVLLGANELGGPKCHGTRHGAIRCGGGIFKLTPDGSDWTYGVMHDFCLKNKDCADGSEATIWAEDANGWVYGTTFFGGTFGKGEVFRIKADGTFHVLYNFCSLANCADGAQPTGLVLDKKGNLFGTTMSGGSGNGGTVFKLTL